jgi:hypothetical protein
MAGLLLSLHRRLHLFTMSTTALLTLASGAVAVGLAPTWSNASGAPAGAHLRTEHRQHVANDRIAFGYLQPSVGGTVVMTVGRASVVRRGDRLPSWS